MQHYARFGRREESININFGLVSPPFPLPLFSLFSDSVSLIPMPAAASLAPLRISNLLALAILTRAHVLRCSLLELNIGEHALLFHALLGLKGPALPYKVFLPVFFPMDAPMQAGTRVRVFNDGRL